MIKKTGRIILWLLLACSAVLTANEHNGDIFTRERSLIAAFRCENLQALNQNAYKVLAAFNPQTTLKNPVFDIVGELIFNSGLLAINTNGWMEAAYYNLSQEKDNDWVYILHSGGEQDFVKAFQGLGDVLRESKEDGIIRFRQTNADYFYTFHVAFTGKDLIVISRSRAATDKARKLYAFSGANGLMGEVKDKYDFNLRLHFSRFLLSYPRFLSSYIEDIRRDVLRDLAGSQAKLDNPLNLGLISGLESIADILRELAVVGIAGRLAGDKIELKLDGVTRYGGSLHYALTNMPESKMSLAGTLPQEVDVFSCGKIWPELYSTVLSGFAATAQAAFGHKVGADGVKSANDFLNILKKSAPVEWASGIYDSPQASKNVGPVYVSVLEFKNPENLSALYESFYNLLTIGEVSELMAEKGIKFEVSFFEDGVTSQGQKIKGLEVSFRSMSFELPEEMGKPQWYTAVIKDKRLIVVTPAAPVNADQYRESEGFIKSVIGKVIAAADAAVDSSLRLSSTLNYDSTNAALGKETFFGSSFSPLRYLQLAVKSQSVWPQPTKPNQLPIPWKSFSQEFSGFQPAAKPLLVKASRQDEVLRLDFSVTLAALKELSASLLELPAPATVK